MLDQPRSRLPPTNRSKVSPQSSPPVGSSYVTTRWAGGPALSPTCATPSTDARQGSSARRTFGCQDRTLDFNTLFFFVVTGGDSRGASVRTPLRSRDVGEDLVCHDREQSVRLREGHEPGRSQRQRSRGRAARTLEVGPRPNDIAPLPTSSALFG